MKPQDYQNKMMSPAPENKHVPTGYIQIDRVLEQAEIDELKRIVDAYDGTIPLEQHIHEYPSKYDFSGMRYIAKEKEQQGDTI